MSEVNFMGSLNALATMEAQVQKPFVDAGIALPPLPATLLLSMLKRPEEEKEEEEVVEEEVKKLMVVPRFG